MKLTIRAHGAEYFINEPGGNNGKALRAGVPYEAKVLERIYRRRLRGVAVDAGAHVGNHSLWFAAVCKLEVAAFEPLSFNELLENVRLNRGLQIAAYGLALGAAEGKIGTTGKGRLRGDGAIDVMPLDHFAFDELALLKVDVEGMEPDVLAGGLDTIERCRPLIYAECWDDQAERRVADLLEPLGYRHTNTYGATPLLEWEP